MVRAVVGEGGEGCCRPFVGPFAGSPAGSFIIIGPFVGSSASSCTGPAVGIVSSCTASAVDLCAGAAAGQYVDPARRLGQLPACSPAGPAVDVAVDSCASARSAARSASRPARTRRRARRLTCHRAQRVRCSGCVRLTGCVDGIGRARRVRWPGQLKGTRSNRRSGQGKPGACGEPATRRARGPGPPATCVGP
jgi:hypothetical protein